jgi:hypothetical protein
MTRISAKAFLISSRLAEKYRYGHLGISNLMMHVGTVLLVSEQFVFTFTRFLGLEKKKLVLLESIHKPSL